MSAGDGMFDVDVREVHPPAAIVVRRCFGSAQTTNWVAQRLRTEWLPTGGLRRLFHFLATIAAAEDDRASESALDRAYRLQRLLRDREPELVEVVAAVLAVSDLVLERVPLTWAIEALEHAAANREATNGRAA